MSTTLRKKSTVPALRSTSAHRRAHSSPRRAPVTAARRRNAPSSGSSCSAASSSRLTSSTVGGDTSDFAARGARTRAAGLDASQSSSTPCSRARRITACVWRMVFGVIADDRVVTLDRVRRVIISDETEPSIEQVGNSALGDAMLAVVHFCDESCELGLRGSLATSNAARDLAMSSSNRDRVQRSRATPSTPAVSPEASPSRGGTLAISGPREGQRHLATCCKLEKWPLTCASSVGPGGIEPPTRGL